MSNRAFDGLPTEVQQVLRTAAGKLEARFDDAGRNMDEQLLNGLLQKQGLEPKINPNSQLAGLKQG